MAVAKKRVALHHGTTVRTIDRTWSRRAEYTIDMDADTVRSMIDELLRPQTDGEIRPIEVLGVDAAP